MRADRDIILSIVFGIALIPKISKQEKPEDCTPGKEFWSTFFNSKGSCAPCPRYVENCKEQGADASECKKSCGAKQLISSPIPSLTASLTPTTSYMHQVTKVVNSSPTRSIPMVNSSTVPPSINPTEYKKIHADDEERWVYILIAVIAAAALVVGVGVAVVMWLRKIRKAQRNRDEFDNFTLRRPVQASPSSLKIGGIQDTERDVQGSSTHMHETNS